MSAWFTRRQFLLGVFALAAPWPQALHAASPTDETFSFYFPTPDATVQRMLELARVTADDFVMDLGSGDGRIVIAAARRYGARGLGIDIDAALVEKSNAEAQRHKLGERARFEVGDLIAADVSRASVITLFLLPPLMARVRPKLLRELKPGARIVAHEFPLPGWPPDETLTLYAPTRNAGSGGDSTLRLWTVPANFSGEWSWRVEDVPPATVEISITQRYQRASGAVRRGTELLPLTNVSVSGAVLAFTCAMAGAEYHVSARFDGDTLNGELRVRRGNTERKQRFAAQRTSPPQPLDVSSP